MNQIYRYFAEPHLFSTYRQVAQICDICHCEALGYAGPFYGSYELEFVCEPCLLTGRLAEYGCSTNSPDTVGLSQNLRRMYPALSDGQFRLMSEQRTEELVTRTPHAVTWQDFDWPSHCEDYCRYLKEIGKRDIAELTHGGDGKYFMRTHLQQVHHDDEVDWIWEVLRPDVPRNGEIAYDIGVYLFQCLTCSEYVILWDMS
jgi:uncharacterized protein CbrC (UPF0167 family)